MIPAIAAAPAAFGAGGGGIFGNMIAGGVSNGVLGAADAGVRSGGDPNAIENGAMWGAGLGWAGPAIGRVVGAGVNAAVQRFGPRISSAEHAFARAAGADAVNDLPQQLAQMGPDAMPMDLGPNLQRQAGALAAAPGRGQEIVRSAVANRQAASGERITGALDKAMGAPVDTLALADDIIARRSAAAKPLYEEAYSKSIPWTKTLEALLGRPSAARALQQAQRLAADEGIPSQQWFAKVADDGQVVIKNVPDVRQLDLTKRALDDMVSAAKKGGSDNEARILDGIRRGLLQQMDHHVPEYAVARQAYSGPAQVIDALQEGGDAFSGNLTPTQLQARLMKMGDAEKDAFLQGARAKVAEIMGTARNDALAARNTFQKGWNKEKLGILIGRDEASQMLRSLDAETAFARTGNIVTGSSETEARRLAQQDIGNGTKNPGLIRSMLNMRFGDAAADLGDKAIGGVRNAAQIRTNEELARLLSAKDPTGISRSIRLVQAAQQRGDLSAQRARELTSSIMLSGSQHRPLEITIHGRSGR